MIKFCRYGLVFSSLHLLSFVSYNFYVVSVAARSGQAQLLWLVWILIDFPISLIDFVAQYLDIFSLYTIYIVHGLLGTIWWYFIPTILFKFSLKKK